MKNEHGIDPSEHFSSLLPEGQEWFSPKEAGNIIAVPTNSYVTVSARAR